MKKKMLRIMYLLLAVLTVFQTACNHSDDPTVTDSMEPTEASRSEQTTEVPQQDPDLSTIPFVIWDFSNEDTMKLSDVEFVEASSGGYQFTEAKGMKAVSLSYSYHSKYAAYRMEIKPIGKSDAFTKYHTWVRVTYMTANETKSQIALRDVETNERVVLVSNTSASAGEFVTSEPISLEKSNLLDCLMGGKQVNVEFNAMTSSSDIFIKEIAFFSTQDMAYKHYGDSAGAFVEKISMRFGNTGNAKGYSESDDVNGVYEYDMLQNAVVLKYTADPTDPSMGNYLFNPMFHEAGKVSSSYAFVRVLYSAENPQGADKVRMSIRLDSRPNISVTWDQISSTDGYVLSEVRMMPLDLIQSLADGKHVSMHFQSTVQGGEYRVKAIYFFKTKTDANAFEVMERKSQIMIGETSMSEYSIVLPDGAVKREYDSAKTLQSMIYQMSGSLLSIVSDTSAPNAHEILIGKTNRAESQNAYAGYFEAGADIGAYSLKRIGEKLVFAAFYNPGLEDLITKFRDEYLQYSQEDRPAKIQIDQVNIVGTRSGSALLEKYTKWTDTDNVSDPMVFEDDFSGKNSWNEEGTESNWKIENGFARSSGSDYELMYLQAYEKNVVFSADLTPDAMSSSSGIFGLQLRYTSRYGYVRGGYDYSQKEWFIEYREGEDFTPVRNAVKQDSLIAGKTYRVQLTANNATVTLAVDGQSWLSATVSHVTPGRVAIFDENVSLKADNVFVEFSSGMCRNIISNVTHTVLPSEAYLEGGTVIELGDGYLHYVQHSGAAYVSKDGGNTWESEATWYSSVYPSIVTLQNGDLLRVSAEAVNGISSVVMQNSTDGGKTWKTIGTVCPRLYPGTTSFWANNMNDKITQISTGRIFYVQSYENTRGDTALNGRLTFCVVYYSDDNGVTWKQSANSTLDLTDMSFFSEAKVMECANGTLRLLSSWNNYSTIMYSESTDGGVTWGALKPMENFYSACSSMAFMKDPNGATAYSYYMVWCNDELSVKNPSGSTAITMPRSRLTLAYTEDGIHWEILGDIWCWRSNYTYRYGMLNHLVDPFIYVTDDDVIVGSGLSEKWKVIGEGSSNVHQAQRQHIWRISKDGLVG